MEPVGWKWAPVGHQPVSHRKAVRFTADAAKTLLTVEEAQAVAQLRLAKPTTPETLIYITDPNRDPDDVVTFVVGAQLEKEGFYKLDSAVTTLGDEAVRSKRARFAKQLFKRLDLGHVPVMIGKSYPYASDKRQADDQIFLDPNTQATQPDEGLLSPPEAVAPPSARFLMDRLQAAPAKSVRLLVIAGMGDPAQLLDYAEGRDLLKTRLKHVVIMGGVDGVDADGFVKADSRAFNNSVDQAAADRFYRGVQELGIPLTVLQKEAAYACAVAPGFYQAWADADAGKGIGKYLQRVQKAALHKLWEAVVQKINPDLTPDWFYRFFIAPDDQPKQADIDAFTQSAGTQPFDQAVWPRLSRMNLYDPLTLLAALPAVSAQLYQPKAVHGAAHSPVYVIGRDQVSDAPRAKALLSGLGKLMLADKPLA